MGNVVRASGFAKLKPGRHRVGDRLYLQVTPTGVKSWVFRYKFAGPERQMGLGPRRHVSVTEAKRQAAALNTKLSPASTRSSGRSCRS